MTIWTDGQTHDDSIYWASIALHGKNLYSESCTLSRCTNILNFMMTRRSIGTFIQANIFKIALPLIYCEWNASCLTRTQSSKAKHNSSLAQECSPNSHRTQWADRQASVVPANRCGHWLLHVVRSFFAGRGPAYSGPQRWDLLKRSNAPAPRERERERELYSPLKLEQKNHTIE